MTVERVATSMVWLVGLGACSDPGGEATAGTGGSGVSSVDSGSLGDADSTAGTGGSSEASGASAGDDSGDGAGPPDPVKFDLGTPPDVPPGGCFGAGGDATLTGTVFAPNGEIPVSGALVYTSVDEPEGIPQQVYCAECQTLGCDDRFTTTAFDGTFTLPTGSGDKYLVVQKGQFMRITPIQVDPGPTELDPELTSLPGRNEPEQGLFIPRIAVADASYDRIEDAFGKFGLGDTLIESFEERLVAGTESFDLYDNGHSPTIEGFVSQGTFSQLVADPQRLAGYHTIFVGCSNDIELDLALEDPQSVTNIREWVAAGGRWYVADWSNEWIGAVFPEYQTFWGAPGSTDLSSYDSLATILDEDLQAWLDALPAGLKDINPLNDDDDDHPTLLQLPLVPTVDNFSGIAEILPVLVDDGMGNQVDVGYRVWLEGPGGASIPDTEILPLTVTGQFGCGKLQFTSYHAAEFENYVGLTPQELVLLYTILEIGVCQEPLPPPEG